MRRLICNALALVVGLSLSFVANTSFAKYPEKNINMIVAFTAGGSSDTQARIMQKYWEKEKLPQWVFIYKPGAGGAIGFGEIAKAKKDGYTIGGINVPHIVLQPLGQDAQFTHESFDYIAQVVNDPQCIAVRQDSSFKNVKEVFDYAAANPGKLKVGLVGRLSGNHLMLLDTQEKYNFPVTEIAYKGATDQTAALLGKEIDVIFGNLNDVMRSLEHMRVLALASEKRSEVFLPDVPTLKEEGYDIVSYIRRGYAAPKGLDPEALAFLRASFAKIANDPEYIKEMVLIGQPYEYLDGEAFGAYIKEQDASARAVLQRAGLLKQGK